MTVDTVAELSAYPPRRLVRGLRVPSSQMQMIIWLTLINRRSHDDPSLWTGVLPALLRAFRETETQDQKIKAWMAILSDPQIFAEDVETVFHFVDQQLAESEHW